MDMLFDNEDPDYTEIGMMISDLKTAVLTCSELCVTIEFGDFADTRKKLSDINLTLTQTWRQLAELQNEFKDYYKKQTKQ